jgi:hypothetical protein
MRRECFQSDQTRRASTEIEARARISTLQREELLTQSEILEKETSPPEAYHHYKAEPDEAKHVRIYSRAVVGWQQPGY